MVSIIGSKDQLVNEYRVMLAEKLLSKSDFDIDSDIRTLELLKVKTNFLISSYLVKTSDWTALDVLPLLWPLYFLCLCCFGRFILVRAACRSVRLCSMT
jgi:hypothetical protein